MILKDNVIKTLFLFFFIAIPVGIVAQINENQEDEPTDTVIVPQKPILLKHRGNMSSIDSIIAFSRTFIGTPYRYGGTTAKGFDCSGFMVHIFKTFSINLPRTGSSQYQSHTDIPRKTIRKGDLVFFAGRQKSKRIGHVGMVVSDSIENGVFRFIHSSTNRGVIISYSNEEYYANRYLSACRIIEVIKDTTAASAEDNNNSVFHIVKNGETLYSIAKKYDVAVDSIISFNNITKNKIHKGQNLIIKKAKKQDNKTAIPIKPQKTSEEDKINNRERSPIIYSVKKGDTLYSLAKKYNISVSKIKTDNKLNTNSLRIEQKIKIIQN